MFSVLTLALVQASAPAAAVPAPKPAKICRTTADSTSRLGARKVCRTADEWARIDEANAAQVDRIK